MKTNLNHYLPFTDIEMRSFDIGNNVHLNTEEGVMSISKKYGIEDYYSQEIDNVSFCEIPVANERMEALLIHMKDGDKILFFSQGDRNYIENGINSCNDEMMKSLNSIIRGMDHTVADSCGAIVNKILKDNFISSYEFSEQAGKIIFRMVGPKIELSNSTPLGFVTYNSQILNTQFKYSKRVSDWLFETERMFEVVDEITRDEMEKLKLLLPLILPKNREYCKDILEYREFYPIAKVIDSYCNASSEVSEETAIKKYSLLVNEKTVYEKADYETLVSNLEYLKTVIVTNDNFIRNFERFSDEMSGLKNNLKAKNAVKNFSICSYDYLISYAHSMSRKMLVEIYGDLNENKKLVLEMLHKKQFFQKVLNEFSACRNSKNELLNLKMIAEKCRIDTSCFSDYLIYLAHAEILLSNRLNELNRNKDRWHYIDSRALLQAEFYLYDVKTTEELMKKKNDIMYSMKRAMGAKGESYVSHVLDFLSKDDFIVIEARSIDRDGNKCIKLKNEEKFKHAQELDQIVIGRNAVFLIEVKDYSGEIVINKNGDWSRVTKYNQPGKEYNPLEQCGRHEKILQSIIEEIEGVNIVNVLCLSNNNVNVEGAENFPVKIVKADRLRDYIENFKSDNPVSLETMKEIAEAIYNHTVF